MNNNISIYTPAFLNEVGGRANNEDCVYPLNGNVNNDHSLFIVCDGVGGAAKGEVASSILCASIAEYFQKNNSQINENFISQSVTYAENNMDKYRLKHPESIGMGSTLTLLSIKENKILVAWAGDSRVYQIRKGIIIYKTEDHSLVHILLKQGQITPEEAKHHPKKNQIFRAVSSSKNPVKVDVIELTDIKNEDFFFMCTDGVLEQLTDEYLSSLCNENLNCDEITKLVYQCCFGNTKDNFSCYLVQVKEAPSPIALTETKIKNNTPNSPFHVIPDREVAVKFSIPKLKYYIFCFGILLFCAGYFFYRNSKPETKIFNTTPVINQQGPTQTKTIQSDTNQTKQDTINSNKQ